MSEPVVAQEVAEKEYEAMVEALDGADGPNVRAAMMGAIMAGRLSLDGGKLVYLLAVPIEHEKGGGKTDTVTIAEPTAEDMEYINRGMKVQASADGKEVYIDMGEVYVKTRRLLMSGAGGKMPLGLVNRIKRRDMAVLGEVCNFFG